MDTSALKKFAQNARTALLEQVASKLALVLKPESAARREVPATVNQLEKALKELGKTALIDQVAYTWFNRFCALRFMDVNGYNRVGVLSPTEGQLQPEILAEAKAGVIDYELVASRTREKVFGLLNGSIQSPDSQTEAYRLLIVSVCNAHYAVMPFLFERIQDFTELLMPNDLLSSNSILAYIREVMTEESCQDVEVIGWLYQFYISEKKDEVFAGLKKNQKITAENIPAATQLFTPHWIVRYLVENSLGRLWLLNNPSTKLAEKMDYYIEPAPAADGLDQLECNFPQVSRPEEIRICDPACGSGHMLTYAFDLLYAIYEEEGYDTTDIPSLILTHNLYGIEIDERAGALAAFALVMKAADKLGRRRFMQMEVTPNVCVLQNVSFEESELQDYMAEVGLDLFTADLREMLSQFEQAKNFGSLIIPKLRDPAEVARVIETKDFEGNLFLHDVHTRVLAVLGMAEALSNKYHVVVANPPYMGSGKMNNSLTGFSKEEYPDSKSDLYAMFMERAFTFCMTHGMASMINMQSWMFLSSFEKLRGKIFSSCRLLNMAHLGERGFDTIGGAVVSTTAFVIKVGRERAHTGEYLRLVDGMSEVEKSTMAMEAIANRKKPIFFRLNDDDMKAIPGQPVAYWLPSSILKLFKAGTLGQKFNAKEGVGTRNDEVFMRLQWEVSRANVGKDCRWIQSDKAGDSRRWYMGFNFLMDWENDGMRIRNYRNDDGSLRSRPQNTQYLYKGGVTWAKVSAGAHAFRWRPQGYGFNDAAPTLFGGNVFQTLAQLNSVVMKPLLAATGNTINISTGTLGSLPFLQAGRDIQLLSENASNLVELAKSDWDASETSWDFTTLPLLSSGHRAKTLECTYASLCTHWRSQTLEMQQREEENNLIFIDTYGLQDELTPEVLLKEITLTCNPAYRYSGKNSDAGQVTRLRTDTIVEFLHYSVGCMFGRYSLDAPGLILANQAETLADYLAKVPQPSFEPDFDNVIPLIDFEGDWFEDDISELFKQFLKVTFGQERFTENLSFIEESLGKDIHKYFVKDFYNDHVKRYKKRPIYWLFSSAKGTFNALIYLHRYRPDTVSVVLNDYLREFRTKLQARKDNYEQIGISASSSQKEKTQALKAIDKINKAIDEVNEYERDVLYPLAGRNLMIDLDDGVKRNYPLFGSALKKITGLSLSTNR